MDKIIVQLEKLQCELDKIYDTRYPKMTTKYRATFDQIISALEFAHAHLEALSAGTITEGKDGTKCLPID